MLTPDQWDLVIHSLQETLEVFKSYAYYPSEEFRREQLERVEGTIQAARRSRKKLKP